MGSSLSRWRELVSRRHVHLARLRRSHAGSRDELSFKDFSKRLLWQAHCMWAEGYKHLIRQGQGGFGSHGIYTCYSMSYGSRNGSCDKIRWGNATARPGHGQFWYLHRVWGADAFISIASWPF